ncbi:M23 family metallopeptidase [Chryseobacterium caseinilyticum]|uniref:M23 family metallopeptidase n=1 Tax=Chryseobacterium caseinilyticum TaxID=2771428 RepID=A0ABR8ZI20_9FLAO|nr:M23 family metallopeptidase [Chryseobacterium caseinilyticum]MBD8084535.1 M23 family metallopeptidase [Chryseobacterium caseinilyticum]
MFRSKSILLILITLSFIISCDGLKIPKNVFETSERAKYERSFSGADSLLTQWKASLSSASASQLKIKDGTSLLINSDQLKSDAVGYLMDLKKGDLLLVETASTLPDKKIFVDLLDPASGSEMMKSQIIEDNLFSKPVETDGLHKVIVQPEIGYGSQLKIKIYTQPSLQFPVAGKGNKNVQSFWGASRDGGGRSHEGVDIFAPKGTPVVAVADGYITRTGNQGLGGKQVWLRDDEVGNSHYYAHLDSILTEGGRKVKTGDTLGLVGNTGNAAGGATHLHFGIYSTGGAVDPYPFIRERSVPKFISPTTSEKFSGKNLKSGSSLRSGSGNEYEVLSTVSSKIQTTVIAVHGIWFHVKTIDGKEGFVKGSQIEK